MHLWGEDRYTPCWGPEVLPKQKDLDLTRTYSRPGPLFTHFSLGISVTLVLYCRGGNGAPRGTSQGLGAGQDAQGWVSPSDQRGVSVTGRCPRGVKMPGTEHLPRWLSTMLHIFLPILQGEKLSPFI